MSIDCKAAEIFDDDGTPPKNVPRGDRVQTTTFLFLIEEKRRIQNTLVNSEITERLAWIRRVAAAG